MEKKYILWLAPGDDVWADVVHVEEKCGARADVVHRVASAIALLRTSHYDLVIVEVAWDPSKVTTWQDSGLAVIERLRAGCFSSARNARNTPVIMVCESLKVLVARTGEAPEFVWNVAKRLGVQHYVAKRHPLSGPHSLVDAVTQIFAPAASQIPESFPIPVDDHGGIETY